VDELEEIIVGTSTMPVTDWRKAHTFAHMTLALYNCRLASFIVNYLKQQYSISLRNFFEYLVAEVNSSQRYRTLNDALEIISKCQQSILDEESSLVTLDFTGHLLLEAHEAACLVLLNDIASFYSELWSLVNEYMVSKDLTVDREVLKEIFRYQAAVIPTWKTPTNYTVGFEFNIPQYFQVLCGGEDPIEIAGKKTYAKVEDETGYIDDPVEFVKRRLTVAMFKIGQVKSISTIIETLPVEFEMSSIYRNLEFI